ncbi:hypothetical protein [Sandarakinorhabdus oryzae]|uniref:hypothetical protein n=1 Tax=Sandarakinorhabdus oryzae TaxID=2675220 RepID=UPI0012E1A2F6|nr:hypothetical protein [Sandarakinorhabdus oryzae]
MKLNKIHQALASALKSADIFRFVISHENKIIACGPRSDIMCAFSPYLRRRGGEYIIYIDNMIIVGAGSDCDEEEIIKKN